MTSQGTPDQGGLPQVNLKQIDAGCNRFEAAWRSGDRPDLGAFPAAIPEPARPRLFSERL